MDVQDLVAEEGEGLLGVQGVQRDEAHAVTMRTDGGEGAVEGGEGVVAQKEANPRIVPGAPLVVERAEAIEPADGALAFVRRVEREHRRVRGLAPGRARLPVQGRPPVRVFR